MNFSGSAENKSLYETIFRLSPFGILILNATTLEIRLANPYARELFLGGEWNESKNNYLDLFPPEDHERILSGIENIVSGQSVSEITTRRRNTRNGPLLTRLEMVSLKDPGEGTEQILVRMEDVSSLMETLPGSSHDLLSQFVSESPASIAMLDRDMKYIAVSPRWISDHQLEEKTLAGTSHYEAFPNLPERWKTEHQRALQGEAIHVDEEPLQRKNGKTKWLRRDIRPWRAQGRDIGGVLIFSEDITAKKNAEDALQHSEFRYRGVIEAASDGFVMADLKGNIQAVNRAYVTLSGYSEDELLAMRISDLEVQESPDEIRHRINRLLETGHTLFESVHRRKNKTSFPVEISASTVPSMGGTVFAFIRDITDRKKAQARIAKYVRQVEQFTEDTLKAVSNMVEQRDPYTAGHERRVGILAADIARELGFSEKRCEDLRLIAHVHDIGKIGIPSEILTKPSKLTPLEYQMVQTHVERGYEILKDVKFTLPIAEIIYQHHERMDGSGYPRRLKGDEILKEARILAVADVVESMMSHRPYRPSHGLEKALQEIEENAGKLYDPDVAAACLKLFREQAYTLPLTY